VGDSAAFDPTSLVALALILAPFRTPPLLGLLPRFVDCGDGPKLELFLLGKGDAKHAGNGPVPRTADSSGNVWDNAAMESFFSSLKTERTGRKTYRTRDEARADVFDYIERFYNPKRRHSTIGYLSPMEFESQVGLA
jgi:transposase InsO family protein